VKCTKLLAALTCPILVFSLVGCGAFQGKTNNLQSIQLSTSNAVETPGSTLDLVGIGGTLQLYTWGNYSSGVPKLLNDVAVTYQISITPGSEVLDEFGDYVPLTAVPPDTVQMTQNGLLTAVTPFACTWVNTATQGTSPAWAIAGSYTVTATYSGLTSPPAFVVLASAAGITSTTNPTGECGPPSSGS
jgi:hypothetical protein